MCFLTSILLHSPGVTVLHWVQGYRHPARPDERRKSIERKLRDLVRVGQALDRNAATNARSRASTELGGSARWRPRGLPIEGVRGERTRDTSPPVASHTMRRGQNQTNRHDAGAIPKPGDWIERRLRKSLPECVENRVFPGDHTSHVDHSDPQQER